MMYRCQNQSTAAC